MKNRFLYIVFLAIVLGVIAGSYTTPTTEFLGVPLLRIYGLIGQLFLNALTLLIIPLVASSIITGSARIGADQGFAVLGGRTFATYLLTNISAMLVGFFVFWVIQPAQNFKGIGNAAGALASTVVPPSNTFDTIELILLKVVPSNVLAAATQGQTLGLIFFCILFGYLLSQIEKGPAAILISFWQGIFQIMMKMTHLIMYALPLGVFGLVAKAATTTGIETVQSLALFFITVIASLGIFAFIVLPFYLLVLGRVNPWAHIRAMSPALFTAFSTSSSAASLPIALECVEHDVGVSNRICSFTLPLGASLNMAAAALYQCVATLFIAQAYGIELPSASLISLALMALLNSMGMAGVPSASLISVIAVLSMLGLPADGVGLLIAVERALDMCRAPVNILTNSCSTVMVARFMGEQTNIALKKDKVIA